MLSTMKVLEIYKHINMLKVNNLSQGFLCLELLELRWIREELRWIRE